MEKVVKEFSHTDLENGNVWYESFNQYESQDDDCYRSNDENSDNQNDINCASSSSADCNQQFKSNCNLRGLSSSQNSKYDHLLFEVECLIQIKK